MDFSIKQWILTSLVVFLLIQNVFSQQLPYSGTPAIIPGQIEAEDFDTGGEGSVLTQNFIQVSNLTEGLYRRRKIALS